MTVTLQGVPEPAEAGRVTVNPMAVAEMPGVGR